MNIIGQTIRDQTAWAELDLPQHQSLGIQYYSNESISTTTVEVEDEEEVDALNDTPDTLFEVDSISDDYSVEEEGEDSVSADDHSAAPSMNEAPPTYEEVIDFDHSIALVSNYRTL